MISQVNWDQLKKDCQVAFSCSEYHMRFSELKKDSTETRRILRTRNQIARITSAVKRSLEENPDQNPEQLFSSVIAILAPWFLTWLISAFERTIINWLIEKVFRNERESSENDA